jgi:uncharacterized protein YndB with AHSA1/START domain
MTPKMIVENSISINAPLEKVWKTLTSPDHTKKYMFGCEALSDWKDGSPLVWKGSAGGVEKIFVKGTILKIEPPVLLKYTVIDPDATYEDTPENHLNVTYRLSGEEGETILSVTQDGFENAAEGEKRYQDVYNNGEGWNPVLKEIKKVAESL